MNKLVSTFVVITLALLLGVGAYIFYLWATYIDRAVDSGQAYGLSIGDTKLKTFEKLPIAFEQIGSGQEIFTEVRADSAMAAKLGVSPGRHVMVQPRLDAFGSGALSAQDQWTFYVGRAHRDFLRLSFCNEKLCRIYRHRKYFELP
jgi:hypothetical protein